MDIAIIDGCIEIAIQAPVGVPEMGAHFIVITDPELRRSVSALYAKALHPVVDEWEAALDASNPEDDATRKVFNTYRWAADTLHLVPVCVANSHSSGNGCLEKSVAV